MSKSLSIIGRGVCAFALSFAGLSVFVGAAGAVTAPPQPTLNSVSMNKDGTVTVNYTPGAANITQVTGYVVVAGSGGTAGTTVLASQSDPSLTSLTFTPTAAFTSGTQLFVEAASATQGYSTASTGYAALTVPTANLTGLTITATSGATIVSWTNPSQTTALGALSASSNEVAVTAKQVKTVVTVNGVAACTALLAATSCSFTNASAGLSDGGTYTFTAKAYNAVGGAALAGTSADTVAAMVGSAPSAISGLTATVGLNAALAPAVNLTFTAPGSTGGGTLTYTVYDQNWDSFANTVCTSGVTCYVPIANTSGSLGYASGVTTPYNGIWIVKATNQAGLSTYATSGNTSADFAPSWSGVTFDTITATSAAGASKLKVATSAVATGTTKNPIQLYMAQLYTCTSSLSTTCTVSGSPVAVADPTTATGGKTFTGLTQGVYYYWTFTAYSGAGSSVIRGTVTQIPTTGGPSGVVGKTSALSNSAYTVTWTAPADNGGAAITGYSVQNYVLTNFTPSGVTAQSATGCQGVSGYSTSTDICSTVTVTNTGTTVGMPIFAYVAPTTTTSTTVASVTAGLVGIALTVGSNAGMSVGDTVTFGADTGTITALTSTTGITVTQTSGTTAIASGNAVVDTSALIKTAGTIISKISTTGVVVDFGATAPSPAVTAANTGVVAAGGVKSPVATGSPIATTGLTATFTGLAQGNYYYAVVTATNSLDTPVSTTSANAVASIIGSASVGVAPTKKSTSPTGSATAGTETITWYAGTAAVAAGISGYVLTDTTTGAVECNMAATSTTVYPATYSCTFSTALVGKTDAFSLYAKDANGYNSAATTIYNVASGAPTKVTSFANYPASGNYTILWTEPATVGVPALNSYNVLAIGADGSRVSVTGVARDSTDGIGTYTFTGLSPLTTWTFQVLSVQATGTSAYSNASVAATTSLSVPTAATSLVTTHVSSTALSFSWTDGTSGYVAASATHDGTTSVDYSLSYVGTLTDVHTGAVSTCVAAVSPLNTCTFTGLTTSDTYTFSVQTNSLLGVSATSLTTTVAQGATGVSPAPTGVSATSSTGGTAVVIAWTPPTTDGGLAVASYRADVYAATDYALGSSLANCTSAFGTNTCTITGLTTATSYVIAVKAVNSSGSSKVGTTSITTNGVAGKPTGVTAVNGNGTITVSWTAPALNGGNAISSYTATATAGGTGGTTATCTTTATSCTITVTGPVATATYTIGVIATNAAGNSQAGTPALGTYGAADKVMSPVTVPSAPVSSRFYGAAVGWTAPSSSGGSAITGYVIVASGSNGTQLTATAASTATSYTFTNETAGVTYVYSVAAKNALGQGAYLPSSVADALPVQPTAGVVTITATGSYALSWTPTSAANAESLPLTYQIVATDSSGYVLPAVTTSNTFYSFGVLNPLLTYSFQIYAVTAYGLNSTSPLVPADVWSGATVSGAPTAVVQTTVWYSGVDATTVSFSAPSNTGSSGATHAGTGNSSALGVIYYSVSLVGADGTTASCTAYSASGCVVYGLTPNVAYTATVVANNQVGASTAGSGFFTVTPNAPGAPGSVAVTQTYSGVTGAVSYTVSWTAAATGGLPISSYTATLFDTQADAIAAETSATPGAATGFLGSCTTASGSVLTCTLTSSSTSDTTTRSGYYVLVTAFEGNTTDNHTASVPLSAPQIGLANGPAAAGITVTPLSTGIAVNALTGNTGNVLVSWVANTDAVYGSPYTSNFSAITGYLVTAYDASATGHNVTCTAAAPATSCTLSGIYDNDAYTIVVEEINAATSANDAAAYLTATLDANTGGTTASETSKSFGSSTTTNWSTPDVAWISSTTATYNSITVNWTAPGAATYAAVTGYTVTAGTASCGTVAASATSCTITGLNANTAYTVSVTASSVLGAGTASSVASVRTASAVLPAAPTAVAATPAFSLTYGDVANVTWTAPTIAAGGAPITATTVKATNTTTGAVVTCTITGAAAALCPALVVGNSYAVTVTATNAAGVSPASTPVVVAAFGNPSAVTGVTAVRNANGLQVSWTPTATVFGATNSAVAVPVLGYIVSATDQLTGAQFACGVNATYGVVLAPAVTCNIAGLTVGSNYTVSVKAANLLSGLSPAATVSALYNSLTPEPIIATFSKVTAAQKSVSALSPVTKTALSGLISSINDGASIRITGYGTTKAIALARANAAASYLFNNGAAVHITITTVISKTVTTALVTVTSN